jgi:hypothetical protein
MKEIKLTKGYVALVDDEDFDAMNTIRWCVTGLVDSRSHKPRTIYAQHTINGKFCNGVRGKATHIRMHHAIIGYPPSGFEVDHIDHNGLNNQRANLRFVTQRQNHQNISLKKKTSKYAGVWWDDDANRWKSSIKIMGKHKRLGRFFSEEAAHQAYLSALASIGETFVGEIYAINRQG